MDWSGRRRAFRAILAGSACVYPASVFDPVSARIASDIGFECGMFAGSMASAVVLGAPDLILLTLTEFAGQAYRISRASGLPFLVDADHGYGNALNVMRTVRELSAAGVAGLTIEDTDLPRGYGTDGARLISIEEGVGKMRAALTAREDKSLAVIGRTSAMGTTNTDDAVARARAYADAGVDAIFFVGLRDAAQLAAARDALPGVPIILGGAQQPLQDRAMLAAHGVRIALQGHQPFAAAVRAVHDTMRALRDGTPPSALPGLADAAMLRRVLAEDEHAAWTKDFLGG
jgi:carboxyvinyl-carboxyphosphonate phosphorylmutase